MLIKNLYELTEIELTYKSNRSYNERHKVTSAKVAFDLFLNNWNENKIELLEQSKILLLNRSNQVLGISHLSTGGTSGTVVDPKQVFAVALKANASGIILAHNHPSGSLCPSDADDKITHKLYKAGKLLDIEVLDHLIITKEGYYSFAETGRLGVSF
ncbi:MAG: JAB domain-containing protein [Flavobacterium sp.]|nr:JAB domain-containing protein [Flavobacterium sp.]PZO33726.1 MAG: DNA repair protein [Flavobacteriaceae bacterium]